MDADWVIVGAGCAGLSLAAHLVQRGLDGRRVIIVDPRESFGWDRTFCFWPVAPHPFEEAVRHRWSEWVVRADGRQVRSGSRALPYCHLPSTAFYEHALAILERSPGVRLELGVRVSSIQGREDGVTVLTSAGPIRARLAFDGRPPRAHELLRRPEDVTLLQHFGGLLVRARWPVFDPTRAVLMDFEVEPKKPIHFMYVLPFDATTALVEDTWFGGDPRDDWAYEIAVLAYIERRYGLTDLTVEGAEKGAIPMTTAEPPPPVHPRVLPIGTRAGLGKPSTGYAFMNIQRHSAELARRLGRSEVPEWPRPRSARTAFLDRVFLAHLARHPERAAGLFADLFEGVDAEVLIRFLSETSSPLDDWKVMRALPASPLMREAVRSRRIWWR